MSKDAIQVIVPGVMTVAAVGGPALMVGIGAAVAIGCIGYAVYQNVSSSTNKKPLA